jgi:small subunit ribosomal protein S6
MKEAVEKFKLMLSNSGATITNEENWGLRKLAYPIQKKSTGFYCLLQFDAEAKVIADLETNYRRDERVLRFLTFRLEKYAYEYAEKRKGLKSKEVKEN